MTTSQNTSLTRIAQVVGITVSAFVAGKASSISYATVPPLLLAPAPLAARQWQRLYGIGAATSPPIAAASGISLWYLAWQEGKRVRAGTSRNPNAYYLYTVAALIIPAIIPFTLIFMRKINGKLQAKARSLALAKPGDDAWEERGVPHDEKVASLINRWKWYNATRGVLTAAGSVFALTAVLVQL